MAHRKTRTDYDYSGAGAAGIFALVMLVTLIYYLWPFIVAGIVVTLLIFWIRLCVADSKRVPAIHHPPKRVKAKKAKPVKAKPTGPVIMRRWNAARRKDAAREHEQWQERFDLMS